MPGVQRVAATPAIVGGAGDEAAATESMHDHLHSVIMSQPLGDAPR